MSAHERERLSAYLDDALPSAERAAVEAHLAACEECRALLAALAAVDGAAAGLPVAAPEGYFDDFAARVRVRIEAEAAARAPRPRRLRTLPPWAWAVAAVLVLAVVTPLTLRERPAERTAQPPAARPAQPVTLAPAAPEVVSSPPAAEQARAAPAASLPPPAAAPQQQAGPARAGKAAEPQDRAAASTRVREAAPAAPPAPSADAAAVAERKVAGLPASAEASRAKEESADEPALAAAPRGTEVRTATAAAGIERNELAVAGAAPEVGAATVGGAAGAVAPFGAQSEFRRLAAARPAGLAEWRTLRERWLALAARTTGPQADEARVRGIAAGLEAVRAGGGEADRAVFRRDAGAYLARPDALQKERVRALVGAEPPSR